MEVFDLIAGLKTIYKKSVSFQDLDRHLTEADVQRWCAQHGLSRSEFFHNIAEILAVGFNTLGLSFEFCDAIVNDLFGPYTDTAKPKSELFWDVYLAFDEGEYYHGNRDEDPVETYTVPKIALIVEGLEKTNDTPPNTEDK